MGKVIVEQAMTSDPVTIPPETSVKEAARLMVENGVGGLPVVDSGGELVGIVTESDLVVRDSEIEFPSFIHFLAGYVFLPGSLHRFEDNLKKAVANTVGGVMTRDPVTVEADVPVEEVATVMRERKLKRFPVVKEGRVVGIITTADIVRLIGQDIPVED